MPSGVVRLRMAKTYHTMPIAPYGNDDPLDSDKSGLNPLHGHNETQNDIVLRKPGDEPSAPKKFRPFGSSRESARSMAKITNQKYGVKKQGPPEAAEIPFVVDGEGAIRGRQADKSSKYKG